MRILLVSQEVPPDTAWGGIGTYIGHIAPALVRAGAEVHVLSVVRGQQRRSQTRDGVHVHRAPLRRPPGLGRLSPLRLTTDRLTLAAAVAAEVRRLGVAFDVVESPEWGAEALFCLRRFPVVVRLHSSAAQVLPHLGPMRLDETLAARLEDALVRRAQLVIGTSSQIADVRERLPHVATREIPIPVPSADVAALPDGPPPVFFAGRFEPRKGPETLVRAAPKVLADLPDACFELVGRDSASAGHRSYAGWLRELAASLGVSHAVRIHDAWLPREGVLQAMRDAHVCAVPSTWESFGYVAAEAGSVGRAVVASRIPGLADVVTDHVTGLLAPPGDADAWAAALTKLLEDPSIARAMGESAGHTVALRFDPDTIARRTLDAYAEAIGAFRGRPASPTPVGAGR